MTACESMVKIIKFLAYNCDNVTQLTQSKMEALKHILIMKIPSSTTVLGPQGQPQHSLGIKHGAC